MPTYTITIGALTTDIVQPGGDNVGQRKAAFIAVSNAMGISRQHGVHGQIVPDAVVENARELRVPRGAGDAGVWEDSPAPKLAHIIQALKDKAGGRDNP